MNEYDVYIDYLALKRHFTTKGYDYFKYHGKIKASTDAFETRKDRIFFAKLAKKQKPHEILLANMVHNPNSWVGELCGEEGNEIYLDWKKRFDSLEYQFTTELIKFDVDFDKLFTIYNGQHPILLASLLQRKISEETFAIMVHLCKTEDYWNENLSDTVIYPKLMFKAKKYYPFLKLDEKKFRKIIKNQFF